MQHGFRAEHSCESQLLLTTEDLVQNYEDKIQTDLIVLDFSKAFDVIPHQRLLHKLDHYGIRGATLLWIQNFLTTQTQKVVVDGSFSDTAHEVLVYHRVQYLARSYFYAILMTSHPRSHLMFDSLLTTASFIGP